MRLEPIASYMYCQDDQGDPTDINEVDLFSIILLFDGLNPKDTHLKQYLGRKRVFQVCMLKYGHVTKSKVNGRSTQKGQA